MAPCAPPRPPLRRPRAPHPSRACRRRRCAARCRTRCGAPAPCHLTAATLYYTRPRGAATHVPRAVHYWCMHPAAWREGRRAGRRLLCPALRRRVAAAPNTARQTRHVLQHDPPHPQTIPHLATQLKSSSHTHPYPVPITLTASIAVPSCFPPPQRFNLFCARAVSLLTQSCRAALPAAPPGCSHPMLLRLLT